MWNDLRTHWQAGHWASFFLALTPPNLRVGRLPFVFFAGVVLMIVISLLWLLTPQVGSHESRLTFIACIALSLWFLNTGMPTRRVLALVGIYATLHIGLSAYFGQGIFSPRINWLYLIPILMIHIDGRKAGLLWGAVVMGVLSLLTLLTFRGALPQWTPLTQGHDVYAFLRHHDMEALDAFKLALRVFRGVPLEGGMAFTKELLYLHGMVQLLYHLQFYQQDLKSVWLGKLSFEEHVMLMNEPNHLQANLRYFPKDLEAPMVQERLKKLQGLSFSLFNQGFL